MPAATAHDESAVFDHETEAPHGRRRRPAPDWGGDDLFDNVPRRRFSHSADGASPRRRGAHEPAPAPAPAAVAAPSPVAPIGRPAPVQELIAARKAEYEPQRRTVTITGRPGHAFAPRTSGGPARSRGPKTVEQRIGTRPDQIAAWAFALGVLLILLALFT